MQIEVPEIIPQTNITSYGKIYRLIDTTNGKPYVGQTTEEDINDRWSKYKRLNCKSQIKLYNALKAHGPENFLFEVIDTTPQNQPQLDNLEIFYIAKFDSMNNGYNCDPGGRGTGHRSEETKEKISKANKGKKHSEETKRKRSLSHIGKIMSNSSRLKMSLSHMGKKLSEETKYRMSGKNNHRFGKLMSEDIKIKISESKLGHNVSNETKTKISNALTGRKCSNEHRKNISEAFKGSKHPMFGRHHSEETKRKIRESLIKRKLIPIDLSI